MPGENEALSQRPLPRGRHALPQETARAQQRARLLAAMTEIVGEQGLAATTVADVVARAGTSRKTFYEQFENKEDCFLAAYMSGVDRMSALVLASMSEPTDWGQRLRNATETLFGALADDPDFARMYAIEIPLAGGAATDQRAVGFDRFVALLRGIHHEARVAVPELPPISDQTLMAIVGGVGELVRQTIREDGPEAVRDLTDIALKITWTLMRGLHLPPTPEEAEKIRARLERRSKQKQ